MIYQINKINSNPDYITDDANLVSNNLANPLINSINLGNQTDADSLLLQNQQEFFNTVDGHTIYVNKEIVENSNTSWVSIDPETDTIIAEDIYIIYNPIINDRISVSGSSLLSTIESIKQELLVLYGMNTWKIADSIPQPRSTPQPTTEGLQTI